MYEAHGWRCDICRIEVVAGMWRANTACIDHDHETGVIRGVLCNLCNTALGFFDDNRGRLADAIAYLEAHQDTEADG